MQSDVHVLYHTVTSQDLQPHSPDLTSLDFHLWDYMKNFVPEM